MTELLENLWEKAGEEQPGLHRNLAVLATFKIRCFSIIEEYYI